MGVRSLWRVALFFAAAASGFSTGGLTAFRRGTPRSVIERDRVLEDSDEEALQRVLADLEVAKKQSLADGPIVISRCVPEDVIGIFVEDDEARGCTIEFENERDGWVAYLVKMEGEQPHDKGKNEVVFQLSLYARACFYDDGVSPLLDVCAGLKKGTGPGEDATKRRDPDVAVTFRDDRRFRFIFELDHKSNTPQQQARRVDTLFASFGKTLRNVVTVKFSDRRRDDRFPGFAVHYRRDDADDTVHVARAFQVGTGNYNVRKAPIRKVWDEKHFVLDAAVDDGSADGFALESYDFLEEKRLPLRCPSVELAQYFQLSIEQEDFFYDFDAYQPPPPENRRPFILDLYTVMNGIDGFLD